MTLVAAWIRRNRTLHELVVVSDSRISGGESWDSCPKIIPLPRPATIMAMSGDATGAYSFLLQAINTCNLLDGHITGQTDIGNLAKKLRDVYEDSRKHVKDLPFGQKMPEVIHLDVLLAGWSWRNLCFEGYSYRYDAHGRLTMHPLPQLNYGRAYGVYFLGDAAGIAYRSLKKLLRTRDSPFPRRGQFNAREVAREAFLDWEPLEVLLDVIQSKEVTTVGGFPQVSRIYQYGSSEAFVWRDRDAGDFFGGRAVQAAERFDRRVIEIIDGRVHISRSNRSIHNASTPLPPTP